jgi:DNA-binding MarR family transcriptional regulator
VTQAVKHPHDPRIGDPIPHVRAPAPPLHNPGGAHAGQLLGDQRLRRLEAGLDLCHGLLAPLQELDNPQAHGMSKDPDHLRCFVEHAGIKWYLLEVYGHLEIVTSLCIYVNLLLSRSAPPSHNNPLDNNRYHGYIVAMTKLQEEIKQARPFHSPEEEVMLALARTSDALWRGAEEVLKTSGLTGTQYNVLRILRGAGESGLSCGEVSGRMITREPDLTRLLDRLEGRKLVVRARDAGDRRVVNTRITADGLALLGSLDEPVQEQNRRALKHLGAEKLQALARLLDEARAQAP